MKSQDQDRLLRGILDGEELDGLRAGSLEITLAAARERRHRRGVIRTASFLAVMLMAGIAAVTINLQRQVATTAFLPPSPAVSVTQQSTAVSASNNRVPFISDDELLALFPNRAVALIGSPGRQQLVFLDEPQQHPNP
jgi:hypothetical protein